MRKIIATGADFSRYQIVKDWTEVKDSGLQFIIQRLGGWECGKYEDTTQEWNYKMCQVEGIDIGFYYMMPCEIFGKEDEIVEHILSLINNRSFTYPLYLDIELQREVDRQRNTTALLRVLSTLQKNSYYVGVYSSSYYFNRLLNFNELANYDLWVAAWNKGMIRPEMNRDYGMWQHSNTGNVLGVQGNVDLDYAYYDFPTAIIRNKLNNTAAEDVPLKEDCLWSQGNCNNCRCCLTSKEE